VLIAEREMGRQQCGRKFCSSHCPAKAQHKPSHSKCGKYSQPLKKDPVLIPDIVIPARREKEERKGNQGIDRTTSFYFFMCLGCHYEATTRLSLLSRVDLFFLN
jgi:hypothetical protein